MSSIPMTLPDYSGLPDGLTQGLGDTSYNPWNGSNILSGILGGGAGALTGALSNRDQTTTDKKKFNSTGTTSNLIHGSQTQQGTASTNPNLSPAAQRLQQLILQQALKNQADPNLLGYQATAVNNINDAQSAKEALLRNTLASRGLTYSPLAQNEQQDIANQGFGQKVDLANSLPLLKSQLLQDRLASTTNAFRAMPYGTTSSMAASGGQTQKQFGTENQSGTVDDTQTVKGNKTGGGIGGLFSGILGGIGKGLLGGL